ncbi:Macrolide export ATP-binding/permease protein MacB [Vibrio aerogenes CECT 7868]|uniref:Macrolide export ATP-binding/permease protein MacB n=1 Tax=Vibrio aerogenes CECT 7868 TaxID=1216006 RepID=A0A1M5XRZ0_9VIBR|nr:ABC transporter permease [Vibrio aerogenes]SHI02581.1 Macrolide export ATP-binding/permease protein MacB [Vibrio aerogenes CECT 7868]
MMAILQQTLQTLYAYRMKSSLAIIAIAWGVISVVVLIALGEGFYRHQIDSFRFMMNQTQIVVPTQTGKPWQGLPARRELKMTESVMQRIEQAGFIQSYSVRYKQREARVTDNKGHFLTSEVSGVGTNYLQLATLSLQENSRPISPLDIEHHSRVVVVGDRIAAMGKISLNDTIKINGIPFRVIGLLKGSDQGFNFGDRRSVMIPVSTFKDLWDLLPTMLFLQPEKGITGPVLRNNILRFYAGQMHFDPTDHDAMWIPDFSDGAKMITAIFRGIQAFLGASGIMTMAVGALGVANIMFLSVTERTREIGVRMAIGATRRSILSQFVTEGMILIAIGSLIGFAVAAGIVAVLERMPLPDWLGVPVITPGAVIITLIVTGFLAFLASYFPARRASDLTPVLALSARG